MPIIQLNKLLKVSVATTRQRLIAGIILTSVAGFFIISLLAAHGKFTVWPFPCSFKQRYNLPCPTCGMTTAVLAFVRGKIFDAFLIQPAAALMCAVLGICGFLAFIAACFGVYFSFLTRFFEEVRIRHIVLAMIFVLAASWAVTLARAAAINR